MSYRDIAGTRDSRVEKVLSGDTKKVIANESVRKSEELFK